MTFLILYLLSIVIYFIILGLSCFVSISGGDEYKLRNREIVQLFIQGFVPFLNLLLLLVAGILSIEWDSYHLDNFLLGWLRKRYQTKKKNHD